MRHPIFSYPNLPCIGPGPLPQRRHRTALTTLKRAKQEADRINAAVMKVPLDSLDIPISLNMLKRFEREGVNIEDSQQLKLARDLDIIKGPLAAFATTPSPYITTKLEKLRIKDEDARAILADYVDKISSDALPYMRASTVADAVRAANPIERILLPELYQFILANVKYVDDKNLKTFMELTDCKTPTKLYPEARRIKRKIILHIGPTNSGKMYTPLRRLQEAESSVYGGPTRLLAFEVNERVNKSGNGCNLLTGEDQHIREQFERYACTVEMIPLSKDFEVAVLDGIHLINDEERGWAWTQALLGLRAKEIHLCGEVTAVPLIKRICEVTGDTVTVNYYERATELVVEPRGFHNSFSNILPGDCVITFSRKNMFALRKRIESLGNVKAAISYGNLPLECRAEQAKLFNGLNSGYDVLIAADVLELGQNLNVRRIIFERVDKDNGADYQPLTVSEINRMASLAGRFKSQFERGYVCTFNNGDMRVLRQSLAVSNPMPLPRAGLYPTLDQVERVAAEFPEETFAGILEIFEEYRQLDTYYFLCNLTKQKEIANLIQDIDLSVNDRYILVGAPCNTKDGMMAEAMAKFARVISSDDQVNLEDSELVVIPENPVRTTEELRGLENMHKVIVLYLWLSRRYRFPLAFPGAQSAKALKTECEEMIGRSLDEFHDTKTFERIHRRVVLSAPTEMETQSPNRGFVYSGLDLFTGKNSEPKNVEKLAAVLAPFVIEQNMAGQLISPAGNRSHTEQRPWPRPTPSSQIRDDGSWNQNAGKENLQENGFPDSYSDGREKRPWRRSAAYDITYDRRQQRLEARGGQKVSAPRKIFEEQQRDLSDNKENDWSTGGRSDYERRS
ncbi:hypothetical protein HDU78_008364 [Chytriomyces hyalinus]|nr:hypothetical protein HDU78_008364 [Chytriomyces hyalinus]